jgi:uncharacterized protein (TIGR02266 family)
MSEPTMPERRKHSRAAMSIAIELRDTHGFLLLSTSDLSTGGAYFDRSIPQKVGQRVEIRFTLPGDVRPIRCEGEVANVPDSHEYGMGVRFLNLSPADNQRIEAFTNSLAILNPT